MNNAIEQIKKRPFIIILAIGLIILAVAAVAQGNKEATGGTPTEPIHFVD